jgi:hypothetical protein
MLNPVQYGRLLPDELASTFQPNDCQLLNLKGLNGFEAN